MPLDLTKLLPANVRSVQRYKDIISAYQSYLYNDIQPYVEGFTTRYLIDNVTQEDAEKMLYDKGHILTKGNGYTSTFRYVKRELLTLIKRLKAKGCDPSYEQLFYVFDLLGDVYPCIYKPDGSLEPWLDWLVSDELDPDPIFLDTGRTLDEPYESYPYWTLDWGAFVNSTTRHFIVSYVPKFVENTTEWMSQDTALALYNDVDQNKRKVELPHYEFRLYAEASIAGVDTVETWEDYDNTFTVDQHSVYCGGSFVNAAYVQFGDGVHSPVNNAITGVQSLIQQLPLSGFQIKLQNATQLYFKHKIYPTTKFYDYKEIAILDGSMNCIFYSTFPWVRYWPDMLSHGYFLLSVV